MNEMNEILKILPLAFALVLSACLFGGLVLYLTRKKDKPFEVITSKHRKLFNL